MNTLARAVFYGGLTFLMGLGLAATCFAPKARSQTPVSPTCEEGAYGCGHAENHELYKDWKNTKTGGSCCNGEDCRPVRATKDEDGDWRIFIPEFKNVTVGHALQRGWLYVPPSQVQAPDRFRDGRSHACTSPIYPPGSPALDGYKSGYVQIPNVYCFTPAESKI